MAFLSGYLASVSIGDTDYSFDKFTFTRDANLGEVTNMTGNGSSLFVPGVFKGTLKCSGPYDSGAMSDFEVNEEVDIVLGFDGAGTDISCTCIVKSFENDADIKNAQMVNTELWVQGTFSLTPP